MALLGDSINPALMIGDYSGFANAAQIQAAGLTNMGNQIGGAIRDQADQQKEAKKISMASAKQIKAAMDLFPNAKGALEPIYNELRNEDIPISERAAIGAAAPSILNMVIDRETGKEDMALRIRALSGQEKAAEQDFRMNEFKLADAERSTASEIKAAELDATTKEIAGPAIAKYIKDNIDPKMAGAINLDGLTGAEQLEISSKFAPFMKKADDTELTPVEYPLGDGSKAFVLLNKKTGAISQPNIGATDLNPTGGVGDPSSGIGPPPDIMLPGGVVDSGAGVGVDGQAGVLPPRLGITPAPVPQATVRDQIAVQQFSDEKAAKAASAAESVAKSENFLANLEALEKSPGFENLFGPNVGVPTWWAGSAGADAKASFDQLKAMGFLEAVKGMTGMGALSDAEGKKLDVAYLGLQTGMSEEAAKKKIAEIKNTLRTGIKRAAEKGLTKPPAAPESEMTPIQKGASILQGLPPR